VRGGRKTSAAATDALNHDPAACLASDHLGATDATIRPDHPALDDPTPRTSPDDPSLDVLCVLALCVVKLKAFRERRG
jgi:hypothetical protein